MACLERNNNRTSKCDDEIDHQVNNKALLSPNQAGPSSIIRHNNVHPINMSSESDSRLDSVDSSSSSEGNSECTGSYISACSSPNKSLPSSPTGPKFKLIHEGDIQICRLNHTRTILSKILSSKYLRRWERHHLYLTTSGICSKTPSGFIEESISYSQIEDICVITRWEINHKYCIRVIISDGSLLLQVSNAYSRDQWLQSLIWKKTIFKSQKLLSSKRPEILLRELKNLVDLSLTTPLQDECIYQIPLEIISKCLQKDEMWSSKYLVEEIITVISPILERTTPTSEICDFLCKYCQLNPRSSMVLDLFTPVVQRILKHNMDFGKYPKTRVLVQDYILALSCQNDGQKVITDFLNSMHGLPSMCPHPRVLPNLVSICLAAIYSLFEEKRNLQTVNKVNHTSSEWNSHLNCFMDIFEIISAFEDWRKGLSQLLQSIPFPDDALHHHQFTKKFKPVIQNICSDYRCDVHSMVLGIRDEKEGWIDIYAPGGVACDDDGDLWSLMLKMLLSCCCRKKCFLQSMVKSLEASVEPFCSFMLRALRDDETCQQALCAMLELEIIEDKDLQLQIIITLQSTASGKEHYKALSQRQRHLKELQQKGGPKKLSFLPRSTDADVARFLSCGSFGNLECLSLAFTQVTSACAEQLIKLPSLRCLNLWSTQFGDAGLQLISEHLHELQVLNLCETPVTDKGLISLSAMKALRKLNLNSTNLSAHTFEGLKQSLPELEEYDICYTDAW